MSDKYPIRPEWEKHYKTLERIRVSGITNMFGASPYLAQMAGISETMARDVLANWMHNYDALSVQYGWRED